MVLAQVDWGSVPDWFAGVGSIAALGFALFAVLAAYKTNRQQAQQVQLLLAEARESQARNTASWHK